MNFMDLIKKGVIEQFSGTISTPDLLLSLLVAIISILIVAFTYKKNYTGVAFSKSFILSLILLSMVTTLVIRTITSNLALSLGMVGALSIVRFRTAVKDPIDTIFMFWAITIGIMSGAGLYLVTVLATIILSILYSLSFILVFKPSDKYILVIKANKGYADKVSEEMKNKKKCILKTESIKDEIVEFTYEINSKAIADEVLTLKDNNEIKSINLVNVN